MKLYHYTSKNHFADILMSQKILRTRSNLQIPINLHYNAEKNAWVADNDDYRPVVWLTASPVITMAALGTHATPREFKGIPESMAYVVNDSKTAVRLTFEKTPDMVRWTRWAQDNGIDRNLFRTLKDKASDYKNFYVLEQELPITSCIEVNVDGEDITDCNAWFMKYKEGWNQVGEFVDKINNKKK